ncbi:restriction endonuclease subunit S [Clostridium neonatale]|uniref:restriction endonuclease subunit S n=1 Tax=Clostridium neonatale TaxID=137838 RepID=UPI00291BB354|nr:restriction endonuclease subunit S [Clostridium neonatale]CAI3202412.1 type I restriction enzyme, S subunit [Clostridium neonatale]CAI3211204.1 type I restriction enzyme, S subunit [Clostridium neonatale]
MAKKKMTLEEKLEEAIVKDAPYGVSENWIWVKLNGGFAGCLDKFRKPINSTERAKRIGEIPYYGATGQVGFIDDYLTNENLVLVGEDGAPFFDVLKDKSYIIDGKAWVNNHAHILKSYYGLTGNKYLMYYLNVFNYNDYVNGTTRLKLTQASMNNIPVPLPPLKEQQRIVDKIESFFEKLDKAKELIEEARDDFEKRKFSIIYKGISGDLTNNKSKMEFKNGISIPEDWKWIEFKNLGKLERGRSKHRPRNDKCLFGGEYPFIQTGDIANSDVYVIEHKQTLSEFGLNQSKLFKKGTLCITIAANIGDVAILTYDCCFPDSVVGFTPNENVESKYVFYFLTLIKRDLEHFAPATAQKNINLKILGDVEIPVPPLEQQQEIVRILDSLLEEESQVEELTTLEDQIELIKKSILAKAFRGQLGTNCKEDESALELLKDILKE